MLFWISGALLYKCIPAVSKASTNADTTVENVYTVKLVDKAKRNRRFRPDCL